MAKKKFELNRDAEKLLNKYQTVTGKDINDIVNQAIKFYITNQLTPNEVREALKHTDDDASKYIDETIKNRINNDAFSNF